MRATKSTAVWKQYLCRAHLKGKVPYAMNDVIEKDHSSSRHQANRACNQQNCCLWLIFAQSCRPCAFLCTHKVHAISSVKEFCV